MYLFLIPFSIFFTYLSYRRINWAIFFICAFLPSYLLRFEIFGIPITLLELMILILFTVWIIKKYKKQGIALSLQNIKLFNWKYPLIVWLAISAISVAISPSLISALGIWKAYFLEPVLFFIVFINTIKTKEKINFIIKTLGFSALYLSIYAIWQKITGEGISNPFWQAQETRRVTGFFEYPNALGLYLAPIVTLYIGQLFKTIGFQLSTINLKNLIFSITVALLSILSIIFARSDGAIAGILAGIIVLGFLWNKRSRLITAGLLIISLIIFLNTPIIKEPVMTELTFQGPSGKIRTEMWTETFKMLEDRFIFGAGLSGYQEAFDPYHKARHIEVYLYPHNFVFNFWSEVGLLGLVAFLWIVFKYFKIGKDAINRVSNGGLTNNTSTIILIAVMITILVHGLVDVPYFKNDLAVMFWLFIGMMAVNNKN